MNRYCHTESGFSLIEMLVLIVVIGILASVAMQSMTATMQDIRQTRTEREMEVLAKAIVGDPGLKQNNQRSDFGYIGDVGAFPTNLQALRLYRRRWCVSDELAGAVSEPRRLRYLERAVSSPRLRAGQYRFQDRRMGNALLL